MYGRAGGKYVETQPYIFDGFVNDWKMPEINEAFFYFCYVLLSSLL
jgi:hypothetical protein